MADVRVVYASWWIISCGVGRTKLASSGEVIASTGTIKAEVVLLIWKAEGFVVFTGVILFILFAVVKLNAGLFAVLDNGSL